MPESDVTARLTELETQVEELKLVQDLLLRLMSMRRPLAGVLEYYGAPETKERALYQLLDELVGRLNGPERDRPTFGFFAMRLDGIFPDLRGNREFVQLLIDTLKVERPAYRTLHRYMAGQQWPTWT